MTSISPLLIDMWSDFPCPFCFAGKRKIDAALKELGFTVFNADNNYKLGQPITGVPTSDKIALIRYRAFELNPSAPRSTSESIITHIAKKYGGTEASTTSRMEGMKEEFAKPGVDITFNYKDIKMTNSFDAHRLMHFAQEEEQIAKNKGIASAIKERFLKAYFTEGLLLGDHAILKRLSVEAGLPADGVDKVLADPKLYSSEVRADEDQAHRMGIHGVPYFSLNNNAAVINGAEPTERMKAQILRALSKH